MKRGATTLTAITLNLATLSSTIKTRHSGKMTNNIMTLNMTLKTKTLSINETQHNGTQHK